MKHIVFREVTWGIGGAYSAMVYMDAEGKDVNRDYAAVYPTEEAAKEAAKRLQWTRRFRKRVQVGWKS